MILSGVGKRYAVALFNAAVHQDIADQVEGDINGFARLFETNRRFRNFLMSPMVRTDDKKKFVGEVIGERASGLFVKFVTLLIDKKRIGAIGEIAHAYTHLWEQQQGIVEVRAVTAIELDPDTRERVRRTIEDRTGRRVRLEAKTDPDIIGGMILFIDDKIIDGSIRHQLDRLRKSLGEVRVH